MPLLHEFRVLDRRIFVLAAARMVVTLGLAAVLPFLSVTLHRDRGVSAALVGLIWTTAGLSGAAMQWVAGEIADRVGRRPLLLGAMLLRTANLALLGYEILHGGSIAVIAGLVVLNAMLRAFFDPVASAMVADLAGGDHRIAAFSLQRIGVNIGWAFGTMALAVTQGLHISYGQVFYASAVITAVAAVAATAISETRATHHATGPRAPLRFSDLRVYLGDVRLRRFLLATFFFFLLQVQLYAPVSIYAASHLHLSLSQVSHLYSLNGWIVVALQVPAFYVIRRLGTHRVLVLGALMYAVAYGLVGAATSEGHLLACVAAVTLAEIISSPAQLTSATAMAPLGRIGAYAGMFGLAQTAGQSLGPLVGTSLLDALPDRMTWPLLAVCGVAAALLYRSHHRLTHPASSPS